MVGVTMRVNSRWHGKAFYAKVRRHLGQNLANAANALRDGIRESISTQGSYSPPVHSKPGSPPYRQSGDLMKSYFAFTDRRALMAQVGSPLEYARWLEFGTLTMQPRPHIRRNLYGNKMIPLALGRTL